MTSNHNDPVTSQKQNEIETTPPHPIYGKGGEAQSMQAHQGAERHLLSLLTAEFNLREKPATSPSNPQELFDNCIEIVDEVSFGGIVARNNLRSEIGSFLVPAKRTVTYPRVVIEALEELFTQYNKAFLPLIARNSESGNDYQYCFNGEGDPVNYFVQIDMVGLPASFLEISHLLGKDVLTGILRRNIFEIENSLAMYQLLQNISPPESKEAESFFKKQFRSALDELRGRFSKPIALLALTNEKFKAMSRIEFGEMNPESLTDQDVKELSGFDAFFGPRQFLEHLESRGGGCDYLLYVRASDPIEKMKKPETVLVCPLLDNDTTRRVIRENSVTLNIDNSRGLPGAKINDTKEYLVTMGMALRVRSLDDLFSDAFRIHLAEGGGANNFAGGNIFSSTLSSYLLSGGADTEAVRTGQVMLRAKPMKGTYGCYGHKRGQLIDSKFRNELRKELKDRGEYVVQAEMKTPVVSEISEQRKFTFIDRNFLSFTSGKPKFIGGFRLFMDVNCNEAKNGRLHGANSAISCQILPK